MGATQLTHTKGPWSVERCYDGHRTVAQVRSAADVICINATDNAQPVPYNVTLPNAHLLALAPEMYEMLLLAVETIQRFEGMEIDYRAAKDLTQLLKMFNALIAKAE